MAEDSKTAYEELFDKYELREILAAAPVNASMGEGERCAHCGVSYAALNGPVPLPMMRERVEIDAASVGFTLKSDAETIREIDADKEARAVRAFAAAPHPSSELVAALRDGMEKAARIAGQEIDTYNEGMSAVDVRYSFTRAPKWRDGPAIAAAIRAAALTTEGQTAGVEAPGLVAFAKEIVRTMVFDASDLDGAEVQEIALKHGLIRREPFEPAKHKDSEGYAEPGDDWFVFTPSLTEEQG